MALVEQLEASFRQAWLLLYSQGIGEGYISALQQFIQAGIDAYHLGYSLVALNLELLAHQGSEADPLGLPGEETQIRTIWLTLVYMTLCYLEGIDLPTSTLPEAEGLQELVVGVVEAYRAGYSLERLKLELVLETGGSQRPVGEAAILNQWMRLVFLTLELSQAQET
ncbi:hypothetical protein [Anthocerotibacter panamensis]|uniref:hypothetical protein n=1 Tax=Anthocerotibacter panamensis TaxID=2857077 RepID=UPI001C406933|nr:hypothetical protein [Anthocerotibacter panamensis]